MADLWAMLAQMCTQKPSFTKQLFGLLSAPSHPPAQCSDSAGQSLTLYLLTYLLTYKVLLYSAAY